MAYLLIPILHQLVHQIDYVIGVGGLAQNRIGPGDLVCLGPLDIQVCNCALIMPVLPSESVRLFFFYDEADVAPAAPFIMRRALRV